ncbi:MAG: hypothetical protein KDI55_02365 [Anaerolineae bacterium]|nr:hypothetical protein [Anaerolineae bacterium]MCP5428581.1 hypothetical protein [Chromatiaceae bacterium]
MRIDTIMPYIVTFLSVGPMLEGSITIAKFFELYGSLAALFVISNSSIGVVWIFNEARKWRRIESERN